MQNLKTVKEVAKELRVSVATVYAMCAARKLTHRRVGVGRGKILIPSDSVSEYLNGGTVEASTKAPTAPTAFKPPRLRPQHLRMKP
jgi:excisionase family DNA binding protein